MNATYNWAYRPGVSNKYGIVINESDDDLRPDNACYVALFGNDDTGNGSRESPYKTLTKAILQNLAIIIAASGVYREAAPIDSQNLNSTLVGDGDVAIDVSYIGYLLHAIGGVNVYNLEIRGNGIDSCLSSLGFSEPGSLQDIIFNGSWLIINGRTNNNTFVNCIVKNFSGPLFTLDVNTGEQSSLTNCTFVNCNNVYIWQKNTLINSCIFYNCNISAADITQFTKTNYSLFFQTNFKMTAGIGGGGLLYPSIPDGYSYYTTIADLKNAYYNLYNTQSFNGCFIGDPLFNNFTIDDYSLQFDSLAKNLSYFGTYVGAQSIAYAVKTSATEANGSFDFSTNVNLQIADNSITLIDPGQNASIQTKLIINTAGRQLQKFPIYGFNADRNGQYLDSIADLSASVQNAGSPLAVPTPYLVETGAITYDGHVYQPGDRLTTLAGVTSFTTAANGVLREILEAPERHTIMARFGDGGEIIAAGTGLTINYWYYVQTGGVNYNSAVYNAGTGFKAIDNNAFSGSGTVIIALGTEAFQHYEPGIQPTSNNTGDTRTGAIIRGNGDPAYIRGGCGVTEFPINAKFIQLYYIINVNNLKP